MEKLRLCDPTHIYVPHKITQKQKNRIDDQKTTRKFWETSLQRYRDAEKPAEPGLVTEPDTINNNLGGRCSKEHPFPLLALHGEIRNMVYKISISDHDELQKSRSGPRKRAIVGYKSVTLGKRTHRSPPSTPTPKELYEEELWGIFCGVNCEVCQEAMESQDWTEEVDSSCQEYELQRNYESSCRRHTHRHNADVVDVNVRGKWCASPSPLAVTCRQTFQEMWSLLHPEHDGYPQYLGTVKNFNIFPFLRFLVMLENHGLKITGENVAIFLEHKETDDFTNHKKINTYARVKRLIELHWLQVLPLWGCLTDLRDREQQKTSRNETRPFQERRDISFFGEVAVDLEPELCRED